MIDYQYRVYIIKTIARVLGTPPLLVYLSLRAASTVGWERPPGWLVAALYTLSVPVYWSVKNTVEGYASRARAKRLGAQMVPVLRGKLPGNLDLASKLVAGSQDGYAGDIIDEFLDEAGCDTVNIPILWQDKILTRDKNVVKFLLSTGFNSFAKGPQTKMRGYTFLGTGIFTSDGEMAKYHRGLARPYFAKQRISDFTLFEKYTDKTLSVLREVAEAGQPCDVQEVFSRFAVDAGGAFLLGMSDLDSLDAPLPVPRADSDETNKFYQAYNEAASAVSPNIAYQKFVRGFVAAGQGIMKRRISGFKWFFAEFFKDAVMDDARDLRAYLEPISANAIEEEKRSKLESGGKATHREQTAFMQHLVSSTDDTSIVKDQVVNMVLALRDTTTCLLTFTCYMLAQHPEVMEKLRAEILEHCGPSEVPAPEKIRDLRYLRAVLNETLRLIPPVALNERTSVEACVIPTDDPLGPIYIPYSDVPVLFSTISIHRNKNHWGDNAHDFIPERWFTRDGKLITTDPFSFLPFSGGPRICLGMDFAYNQISFFMIRLLQAFDNFTLVQDACAPLDSLPPTEWKGAEGRKAIEKVWVQSSITVSSKGGMWLTMNSA